VLWAQTELPFEARAFPWQRAKRPDETDRGGGLMLSSLFHWKPALTAPQHSA